MSSGRFLQAWENARSRIDAQYTWLETTRELAIAIDRAMTNVRNQKDCNKIERTINFLINEFVPPAEASYIEKWKTMLKNTPEYFNCDVQGMRTRIEGLQVVNKLLMYIRNTTGDDALRAQSFSIVNQLENHETSLDQVKNLVKDSRELLTTLMGKVLLPSGTSQ